MRLEPLHVDSVRYVAANMRDWDRREIWATRLDDSEDGFVSDVMRTGAVAWVAGIDLPIAVFGCFEAWPGMWSMWFFSTDELDKIGLGVTRFIIKRILPMLWDTLGAHRLECKSMEGHVEAQRWLETLGAVREATHKAYGRGHEAFHTYVWERP